MAEQIPDFTWHSAWDAPDGSVTEPLLGFLSPYPAQGKFQKPFLACCIKSKLISSSHRVSCEGSEPAGGLSSAHTMCLQRNEIIFTFYCSSFQVSVYVTLQCTLTLEVIKVIFSNIGFFYTAHIYYNRISTGRGQSVQQNLQNYC